MSNERIRLFLATGGWFSFVVGLGFFAYAGYALAVGRVVVATRSAGEAVIPSSSGWPFALGVLLYVIGALVFLWISRELHKPPQL